MLSKMKKDYETKKQMTGTEIFLRNHGMFEKERFPSKINEAEILGFVYKHIDRVEAEEDKYRVKHNLDNIHFHL